MGRKPKCTVEEKISAVEDYLNGIRSVSEIMVDLSIKSTRTIRNWILAYQNGGIEALCSVTANHSYSSGFKIEMVRKYINGEGSVTDLCARYGIPAHATLQKWISLYNANRELRDYDPKREVYMAEARRKTTLAERKEIVEYCITHNRDYKGTASLYDVSYSQVYSWVRKYDTAGEEKLFQSGIYNEDIMIKREIFVIAGECECFPFFMYPRNNIKADGREVNANTKKSKCGQEK